MISKDFLVKKAFIYFYWKWNILPWNLFFFCFCVRLQFTVLSFHPLKVSHVKGGHSSCVYSLLRGGVIFQLLNRHSVLPTPYNTLREVYIQNRRWCNRLLSSTTPHWTRLICNIVSNIRGNSLPTAVLEELRFQTVFNVKSTLIE